MAKGLKNSRMPNRFFSSCFFAGKSIDYGYSEQKNPGRK